jgi:hypothetical protein
MSERAQTGTKLANSVRQAKMKQAAGQHTPAVRPRISAEQDAPAIVFAARRVWPD